MCDLCKGTHVVHNIGTSAIGFFTCPNCGPMTDEQFKAYLAEIRQKWELEAKKISKTA